MLNVRILRIGGILCGIPLACSSTTTPGGGTASSPGGSSTGSGGQSCFVGWLQVCQAGYNGESCIWNCTTSPAGVWNCISVGCSKAGCGPLADGGSDGFTWQKTSDCPFDAGLAPPFSGSSSGTTSSSSGFSSGTVGGSSGSSSGSTGSGNPCTDDSQCPSGAYCNFTTSPCDGGLSGLATITPGVCLTPTVQALGSCTGNTDCPETLDCVGGKCQFCPQDAGPLPCFGVQAMLCPPHCVAIPQPHICYTTACICPGYACNPPPTCSAATDCGGSGTNHEYACCDGGCFDISGDSANCGGCGTTCLPGVVCAGSCQPPTQGVCPAACAVDAGGLCCGGPFQTGYLVCADAGDSCPACAY